MAKLEEIRRDPNAMTKHPSDQRVLTVMGMMRGSTLRAGRAAASRRRRPRPRPRLAPPPEPEKELTPEEKERLEKKRAADVFKDQGNAAYKAKKFDEAVGFFEQAIAALPDEITGFNNLAAREVRAEGLRRPRRQVQGGDRGGARGARRLQAGGEGVRADRQRVQGAGALAEAIRAYEDSLMEDRAPDVEKRLCRRSPRRRRRRPRRTSTRRRRRRRGRRGTSSSRRASSRRRSRSTARR